MRSTIERFVVRRPLVTAPIACAVLPLVAITFAVHWGDISAGVIRSALVESGAIALVGLATSLWLGSLTTRLIVRDERVESTNGLTRRARSAHPVTDIERYYVYRKIAGGSAYARTDRWTVRVDYRDGQSDDTDATAENAQRLVAYLAARRVPRVDAPPAGDERSLVNWARSAQRTGTATRVVIRTCAAILMLVGAVAMLYFALAVRAAHRSPSWPTVSGQITYSAVSSNGQSSTSTVYTPTVRYAYHVDGRRYEGTHIGFGVYRTTDAILARDVSAHYPVGTAVTVRYDPEKPHSAVLQLKPDRMGWSEIVLSACILCAGLYGLVMRIPPYRRPPL